MRNFLCTLTAVLLALWFVSKSTAQENKETTPKTGGTSTQTKIDQPKSEVDVILEEAEKRGEPVFATCLERCKNSQDTGELVADRVIDLPRPVYPVLGSKVHASGEVGVQVIIDKDGRVIAAHAISGHPLLKAASLKAARETRFTPTLWKGEPVKVVGVITYNFVRE